MSKQEYRIVPGEESRIHDEPHVEGRRITVRFLHGQIEERGLAPQAVAERYDLDVAEVYEALAYYHSNSEEMAAVEDRHERAVDVARDRSSHSPPDER